MAGISADNVRHRDIVQKMSIWPRSKALRANVTFLGQSHNSLEVNYYLTYQQARSAFNYFMTLLLNFVLRIDSNFVDFFVLPRAAFEIRFLMVVPAESTKWVRFYSRRVIKMKNMKLLRQLFYAGFISFQRKKRKTNIDVNGGHCRITIQWFCTTWRKVAVRVEREN